ncbi:hypothetical protein HDU87_007375 [Geranomyces variabilis]|uniref:Uncharacterized protein n=1 Tax=Geranomyces variabilis TaxID=109894 RepID=A0AAD5TU63_9FUNG|nr:hypothetical protein HDU87_007375 [Geranomyces variabilis]
MSATTQGPPVITPPTSPTRSKSGPEPTMNSAGIKRVSQEHHQIDQPAFEQAAATFHSAHDVLSAPEGEDRAPYHHADDEVVRAATGEKVEFHPSVAPATGTPSAPIATAREALSFADVHNIKPPVEVVAAGGDLARAYAEEMEQEQEDEDRDRDQERDQDQDQDQDEQDRDRDAAEKVKARAEHLLHDVHYRVGQDICESEAGPAWNVSQRVDRSKYHPEIQYISGFSNGNETTDPIVLKLHVASEDVQIQFQWLKGALYRNGPGLFDIEYKQKRTVKILSFEHWFDGLPLVHRFEIDFENEKVEYRSRFTARTLEDLTRMNADKGNFSETTGGVGGLGISRMGADPSAACAIHPNFPLGRGNSTSQPHLVLSSQSSILQEIDPVTLIPKHAFKYENINPAFKGTVAGTIPRRDPVKNVLVNFTMDVGIAGNAKYTFFELPEVESFNPPGYTIASVTASPTAAHSFALTANYIVLIVYPYTSTWRTGLKKLNPFRNENSTSSVTEDLYFDPEGNTTFHVIDRNRREEIAVFRTSPLFALSIINASENPAQQTVTIDLNAYDSDDILRCWSLQNLRTANMPPFPAATVRRYVLEKIPEESTVYKIDKKKLPMPYYTHRTDYTLEFPVINPSKIMQQHRYAWGLSISPAKRASTNVLWDTIVKADLDEKSKKEWSADGCYPSEPVMVPSPWNNEQETGGEDRGVVLSVVLDGPRNSSFLLMLDADSMTEIARANLPFHIPFGVHGEWVNQLHA